MTDGMAVAREILAESDQGRSLPTDLVAIGAGEYLEIEQLSSARRFEGRLELILGKPAIFVNTRSRSLEDPRARFTLAHEFGHYFMHRQELGRGDIIHDFAFRFSAETEQREREANDFAAECLLPTAVVRARMKGRIVGLPLVEDIGKAARASLQATAIKMASLATARCCFFWEEEGEIRWTAASESWRKSWMPSGSWRREGLPTGSAASKTVESFSEQAVPKSTWCPAARDRDEQLVESAVRAWYGRLILVVDANADGLIEG